MGSTLFLVFFRVNREGGGGGCTGKSNKINEEINRKYAIFCKALTKNIFHLIPIVYKTNSWTIWTYKRWLLDQFLEGLGRKYIRHYPWCLSDKITTHSDVQEATVWPFFWGKLDGNMFKMIPEVYWTTSRPFWTYKRRLFFFRDGMEGHEETILHFSISWLFTSFCISRNMLFTQRCATRFVYALLTDQKVILSFSPLHRSRQTRKTCQLCKENLSVMQGSLQNWSIYELCQSYARN